MLNIHVHSNKSTDLWSLPGNRAGIRGKGRVDPPCLLHPHPPQQGKRGHLPCTPPPPTPSLSPQPRPQHVHNLSQLLPLRFLPAVLPQHLSGLLPPHSQPPCLLCTPSGPPTTCALSLSPTDLRGREGRGWFHAKLLRRSTAPALLRIRYASPTQGRKWPR